MKTYYVDRLKVSDELQDYFMVKNMTVKTGANNKAYMDFTLIDRTGEISAKKWDLSEVASSALLEGGEGSIVKVRGLVTEWNGTKQIRITKVRLAGENDEIEMGDFIKAAPEKPKDMYDFIRSKAEAIEDEDFRKICLAILDKHHDKLMYYPAASRHHHAEMSGLLYHMKRMLMMAGSACSIYTNLNEDLLTTGVIIHDMEKINEIDSNEYGVAACYTMEGQLLGHIAMGVRNIDKMAEELGLPREKAIILEHMILSHHYEPEFGSPKKPMFPEAEMLHYLDVIDARMYDMELALRSAEPGGFSERVWTLNNIKLYKPSFLESQEAEPDEITYL